MMYQNVNNILLGLIIMANRGEVMDMTVEELRNFYGRFWEDNYDFIHNARSNFVTWSLRPNNSDLISVSNGITDKAPYYQGNVLWRFLSSMIWGCCIQEGSGATTDIGGKTIFAPRSPVVGGFTAVKILISFFNQFI